MKKLSILIIIIAAIFAVYYFYEKNNEKNIEPYVYNPSELVEKTNKENDVVDYAYLINFSFDNDDIISVKYPYTFSPDQSLLAITQDLAKQNNWEFATEDYGEMGTLVTKIRNKENGQNQKYWQYFVEGKQPLMSADKYMPKQGEIIDWKFEESAI